MRACVLVGSFTLTPPPRVCVTACVTVSPGSQVALSIFQEVYGPVHEEVVKQYAAIGLMFGALRRRAEEEVTLLRAMRLVEDVVEQRKINLDDLAGTILNSIALMYLTRNDPSTAIQARVCLQQCIC